MTGPKIKPIPPDPPDIDMKSLDKNRCKECSKVIRRTLAYCDSCFDKLVKEGKRIKR